MISRPVMVRVVILPLGEERGEGECRNEGGEKRGDEGRSERERGGERRREGA